MSDLIVETAVKDTLSDSNISAEFCDVLNDCVSELLNHVTKRGKASDRKMVQPRDL
jgi:histone H3/H4